MAVVKRALGLPRKAKHKLRATAKSALSVSKKPERQNILELRRKALRLALKKQGEVQVRIDAHDPSTRDFAMRSLRFGAVTVANTVPDALTLSTNVLAGRDALVRAVDAFMKAGVSLDHKAGIPKFRVDAKDPRILIRQIGDRTDRGRIINGSFVPAT